MIKTSGKKIAQLGIPKKDIKRSLSSPQNIIQTTTFITFFPQWRGTLRPSEGSLHP